MIMFYTEIIGKHRPLHPVAGEFLGIIGQNPHRFKSNRLHAVTFLYRFEVYSIDSFQWIIDFLDVLNLQPAHL
jgi:hypothetical protein